MIRAVSTGVIDVSLAVQESAEKLKWERERLAKQKLPATASSAAIPKKGPTQGKKAP